VNSPAMTAAASAMPTRPSAIRSEATPSVSCAPTVWSTGKLRRPLARHASRRAIRSAARSQEKGPTPLYWGAGPGGDSVSGAGVWHESTVRDDAEATGLVVLHGLDQLLLGVHDERTVVRDRLADRLPAEQDDLERGAVAVLVR